MSTIYTTFIEREGCFLKVWGQQDKSVPLYIENSLMLMKPQFDSGIDMIDVELLAPGVLCCAKFKDEAYYRARIINVAAKHQGMVEVSFIDYGNRDLVHVSNIRAIANFSSNLISMPAQAKDFILGGIQVTGVFNDPSFGIICNELRYMDFGAQYIAQCGPYVIMSLSLNGQDIVDSFITRSLAVHIPISMQLVVLQSLIKPPSQLQPAMAQQRRPPMMPPQHSPPMVQHQHSPPMMPQQQIQQPSFLTFKSLPLKVGSEHTVFVSYVTDGPCFFSIQLQNKEKELQELMIELNNVPLLSMEETILPGCVCLCRSSEDDYICRGVVTNMVDENFKVFFVDFGNTEIRSFEHIYQIPFKYVIPKVMATRFALNGLQGSVVSVDMKIAFKVFVNNKPLRMRVANPSHKTGVPLCDLWNDVGVSALDYVRCASLQAYPEPAPLTRGVNQEVKVSYVFSCDKFYVQLRNKEEELNQMMESLQSAEMQQISEDFLKVNAPCIALYEVDGMHYRAQIIGVDEGSVLVRYVDYGNEENIPIADIKAPMVEFIMNLRPQAIECCLNGYQNMEREQERDDILEDLILEQNFTMKVVNVQDGRILAELFDGQSKNVASLLFDKLAKLQPPLSPPAQQNNKTSNNKYSPRENKTDSWRERESRQQPRQSSTDWRQKSPRDNCSFDQEGTESRKSNWEQDNNRPTKSNNWDDGTNSNSKANSKVGNSYSSNKRDSWSEGNQQRDVFSNGNRQKDSFRDGNRQKDSFNDGDNQSPLPGGNDSWGDSKRSNNWGGGDRRDNKRENSWGDNRRPERTEFKHRSPREDSFGNENRSNSYGGGAFGNENRSTSYGGGDRRPRRDNRSESGSEKSFGSGKMGRGKRQESFGNSPLKKQQKAVEEVVDYIELSTPFTYQTLVGTSQNVSVSWFYNPVNFFCQLEANKSLFDAMMKEIQYAYKRRKPLDAAEARNSVIALFPEDKALYRAVIMETLPGGSFKVLYVDFGNTGVSNRVFQVERRFTELPVHAVQSSLGNVLPVDTNWPKADAFSKYFDREPMRCQFLNATGANSYIVELTSNEVSIKDELQNAGLIVVDNSYEYFDPSYLLSQQIYCKLDEVNALDDFKLEILPRLSVSCAIYQHDKASQPNLELLRSYGNQMVVAFIDHLQESKISVTLYDIKGQFIPLIELQEEMFDVVDPICPAIVIGPQLSGYVSHATPTRVFIQPSYTASCVDALLEQLFEAYDTTEPVEDLEVKEIVYAVKSPDGNWYRALVKTIAEDGITVQYIDYGNEETVEKTQIRLLREDFFLSYLAVEITLDQAESYIHQAITVNVNFEDDSWIGTVQTMPEASNITLHAEETTPAVPDTIELPVISDTPEVLAPQPEMTEQVHVCELAPQTPTIGFSVQLSHLDNPGQFYLQQSTALDAIDELQCALQPQISTLSDIENISTGILCAAPYSADQVWYRAQVLDADSDITTVRFIDYGNTDVLGNDTKIKTLPTELLSLEEHAKRCSLHLSSLNNEWTTEACTKFEKLTNDASLTAEIVHQDEKSTFVRLYANGICINDVFIAENYAVELQVETSQSFTGFVSHLNSPSEFWIQFEHACSDLEWIADQLTNAEKFKLLEDQAPGALCAAVFPEDDNWYRARILSNTVAGVEVLFIDYGNSCTCTSLRELPEDLVMVPALAHKCSLLKAQGLLEWPLGAIERFKEISADGVTVFTVIKHAQGETNQVQLLFNEEDVSDILIQSAQLFDAVVTHCDSLGEFAIRKVELNEGYLDIQNKIQELSEKPGSDEVVVAGLYEKVWHRAKILGCILDKYVVELIDLGMEVDVTEVRQLPEELRVQEGTAVRVKMIPVAGYVWGEDAESSFKALFVQGETVYQVEFVNEQVVRLFLNGRDVRETIPAVKYTPAASVQNTPRKVQVIPICSEVVTDIEIVESAFVEVEAEIAEPEHNAVTEEEGQAEKCDTITDHMQQIMTDISNSIVDNAEQVEAKSDDGIKENIRESQLYVEPTQLVQAEIEETEVLLPESSKTEVSHSQPQSEELQSMTEDANSVKSDDNPQLETTSDIVTHKTKAESETEAIETDGNSIKSAILSDIVINETKEVSETEALEKSHSSQLETSDIISETKEDSKIVSANSVKSDISQLETVPACDDIKADSGIKTVEISDESFELKANNSNESDNSDISSQLETTSSSDISNESRAESEIQAVESSVENTESKANIPGNKSDSELDTYAEHETTTEGDLSEKVAKQCTLLEATVNRHENGGMKKNESI